MSFTLTAFAIVLIAISGLPSLFINRHSIWGQRVSVLLVCSGAVLGLSGCVLTFLSPDPSLYVFPWISVQNGLIGIDALSAFFLVPVFVVGSLASIYGLAYWRQTRNPRTAPKLQFFFGLMLSGMVILIVSRHAMSFILGWEVMALSAFFLVGTEDDKSESRKSAFIYIIATHIGTLTLFCLFALWRDATGSFEFVPAAAGSLSTTVSNLLFFLTIFGFGMKAGIMPLHFWLPGAHANAPSHVSAVMSGVMIKMGIYGIVRMLSLLPNPPALWGWWILFFGMVSGLLGVAFAIAQHDLKRLLAYHSVENIGIILLGLGVAMLGLSYHKIVWTVLGMAGCLLHVWNHSLFKSLLFMGAGSVIHSTHTRQIDQMGGLARNMPWTASLFLAGAIAICGLPPLNGFISELYVYIGLLRIFISASRSGMLSVFAVPVLSMIGVLAVACFVKVYGTVFLGSSRSRSASHAREVPAYMRVPMIVLAFLCFCIGLVPAITVPILEKAIVSWMPENSLPASGPELSSLVPLGRLGLILPVLFVLGFLPVLLSVLIGHKQKNVGTWDCGYARPTSRMQYTSTSFARSLVDLFGWILRPKTHGLRVEGTFPVSVKMESHVDEVVLDRALLPFSRFVERNLGWWHRFQQGQTQQYLLYILVVLFALLLTLLPYREIAVVIFS